MPLQPLPPFRAPRRASAAQTAQLAVIPAPTGGLNYRDPISAMSPLDALVLTNFIPKQQGVELRKGWQQKTESLTESVESVFGYIAPNADDNKVFVAANGNIYDVTDGNYTAVVLGTGSTDDEWWTTQFSTPGDTGTAERAAAVRQTEAMAAIKAKDTATSEAVAASTRRRGRRSSRPVPRPRCR